MLFDKSSPSQVLSAPNTNFIRPNFPVYPPSNLPKVHEPPVAPTSSTNFFKPRFTKQEILDKQPQIIDPDSPCWVPGHRHHTNKICNFQHPELKIRSILTARSLSVSDDLMAELTKEFSYDEPRLTNNPDEENALSIRQLKMDAINDISQEEAMALLAEFSTANDFISRSAQVDE